MVLEVGFGESSIEPSSSPPDRGLLSFSGEHEIIIVDSFSTYLCCQFQMELGPLGYIFVLETA